MSVLAKSLSSALPKPKYTGEDEELVSQTHSKGPRVVASGTLDESQIAIRRSGPPPYGSRTGWRPRTAEDYGDGGAFPEVPMAQYPLDMGRKTTSSSNALALQVDAEGKIKYDALARRGHSDSRIIHSEFKDLIPLRQRADVGDISLARPSEEEVEATREKTSKALATLVSGAVAAQKPKNVQGLTRNAPTYVQYTPDNQMGNNNAGKSRVIKIVDKVKDPMEPPKHKHKKIPRGPPSPPPPQMHSPPRKLTAEDQENWRIPPPVSNWKNPKGYTIPLDKRLAADGSGLQDKTINDKFAQLAEAMSEADRLAREGVKQRQMMSQKLAEKEKLQQDEHLRSLAQKAREDAANRGRGRAQSARSPRSASYSRSRSRSASSYTSSRSDNSEKVRIRERENKRRENREENERQLRQSRMGTERRIQQMAKEQNRDISEKVALGLAKPSQSGESMYDSRLFNQTSGFNTGFNEDQAYDRPLFAAQDAINSIYRPNTTRGDDDDADETMAKITGEKRFGVLGNAGRGFKGAAEAEQREGPVQFEKDMDDPFGIDEMIKESTSGKRYGMQEADSRPSKRVRVDDDE